jgi:hypothetical protein
MIDYRLSYTAAEINEKLGEIDNKVDATEVNTIVSRAVGNAISVTEIDGGYRLTIEDSKGTHTIDITNDDRSSSSARIGEVTLLASAWVGTESPYSQVVSIPTVTANTQVDLTPSVEQLSIFHNKDLAFVTENEGGTVTVYAIGQKPENDYTVQVTLTEVAI